MNECALPDADQQWIERATRAWQVARMEITPVGELREFDAVFFSAECVATSPDALTSRESGATWRLCAHDGMVRLPDGDAMPAVVSSFTSSSESGTFFVMSTPSVWRGHVDGGALGLETLMVAVMLHEASHVAQASTYGERITRLTQRNSLPESFNDDSLQDMFESEADFADSVEQEIELFFAAADAEDDASAFRLAGEARDLMRLRADRWFVGSDSYWREAEDLWLTFEGSGQWVGYQWLIDERGAAVAPGAAMDGFGRRSRWWSQNLGLAIALTLDRLAGHGWRDNAFGTGELTILEMLDTSLSR